ncbi:DUF3093 domain-containing protein [Gordonia sp. zg691]|uniref:DUF3093 domain-containing protein n=1 Tax=Gordonia jinghuaiqii TaxID=2758710 RepID=A0A7D7LZC3_9ACTN|nr:DUF3093 domain-containing protein [Gordonia jinghuaiqii]MBD0861399.1 DUF3093 domain-containing protein [Gordonia jinghuaiqii]MCR5976299.1 DUF3093 family protein [Gordonia jinghuaiqii]QMT03518.1 DUF3093 domain-containing protein [Gordonia jinghuaiqii]
MTAPQSPDNPGGTSDGRDAGVASSTGNLFDEQLFVPWWWWLAGAVVTGVVGYEIQLSARNSPWSIAGYIATGVLCALMLWSMGRTRIRVTADRELHAHRAVLPRSVMARGASVPATAKSAALGRQLDPAAYLVHRAWVKTMVLIVLDDPDDPTPYWLVSTRRPAELLAALDLTDAAADRPEKSA